MVGFSERRPDGLGWYNYAPSGLASDLNEVLATQKRLADCRGTITPIFRSSEEDWQSTLQAPMAE